MIAQLSKTYGGTSVALCIAYFTNLGQKVSIPLFDDSRYDLIVDDGNKLIRIQCKTATIGKFGKNPDKIYYPRVRLTHGSQKNYTVNDFDFIWAITNELAYLIPISEIGSDNGLLVTAISLPPKYNTFVVDMSFFNIADPRRRMTTPFLTDREKQRIESLYFENNSALSIAKIMGLRESQVEGYIYSHDLTRIHTLSDETKQQIIQKYLSGITITDIAKEVGFGRSTISNVVKESGIKLRRVPVLDPEYKSQIIEMTVAGKTPQEIANYLGVRRSNTISTFLSRHQWLIEEARAKLSSSPTASA